MDKKTNNDIKLREFVANQRKTLPNTIEEYELEELSRKSGYSVDDIRDANDETENFWRRD